VIEEIRIFDLRVEPVIGDHYDEAARGEGAAHELVVAAVAVIPATAIDEEEHRCGAAELLGRIDVEDFSWAGAVGYPVGNLLGAAIHGRADIERVHDAERKGTAAPGHGEEQYQRGEQLLSHKRFLHLENPRLQPSRG